MTCSYRFANAALASLLTPRRTHLPWLLWRMTADNGWGGILLAKMIPSSGCRPLTFRLRKKTADEESPTP